jgi:UDP-2,3-diacylglucosamine pyrophosphatase LpxH
VSLRDDGLCDSVSLSRRAFVRGGTLVLLGAGCVESASTSTAQTSPALRIGLITDLHYAAKPSVGNRYYQESLSKLSEAVKQFRRDRTDFIVELGDFIDSTKSVPKDLENLQKISEALRAAACPAHHVLGNHCVETLTKQEFLEAVDEKESFYSFDFGSSHFVILDACFLSNGEPYGRNNVDWTDANLPNEQLEWLRADLKSTTKPTIVFAHQRLDNAKRYSVKNAEKIRSVFEKSGSVQAVFQGHHHRNDYHEINGIHYCTLLAMVEGSGEESNGYSMIEILGSGTMTVSGFRKQSSYVWKA